MTRRRAGIMLGLASCLLLAAAGGTAWPRTPEAQGRAVAVAAAPPCPPGGIVVPAGAALQPLLDATPMGGVLCLSPGHYRGPFEIHERLTLQGPASAVLRSTGEGTTVRALADSVVLDGFTVDGSGRRYDKMDAAVYLHGDGVVVRDLTIREALFGVVAEQSSGITIARNRITGLATLPVGIRGDGIRLWEVRHSAVVDNHLEDSRDIVIWYAPNNRIAGNTVLRSRYATHFMYSDDCVVANNEYDQNIVGVFVMYSRGITLRNNIITDNTLADGMGLGVKESGNLRVEGNRFVQDHSCVYLDTSPFREGDSVLVRQNTFARCTAGVTFHSSETHNTFLDNTFQANQTQVAIEGRGTARGVVWSGNYFDDYQGYDLDGDGVGDVAYELRSFSERLVSGHPELAFFRGTVALQVLDMAARVFPVLEPATLLVDPRPRMTPAGSP